MLSVPNKVRIDVNVIICFIFSFNKCKQKAFDNFGGDFTQGALGQYDNKCNELHKRQ